jgi:prepilin-type N-terminal cleavage/methylation domain-containing protein
MNKSFTLIEILVVIVVIGIISSFIIVGLSSVSDKANIAKGQAFSNSLRNSLLMNLVSEWKLDGNTNDSWGVNNGTWNGSGGGSYASPSWRTGSECVSGGCLAFDGIDDYVDFNNTNTLRITEQLTLDVWINGSIAENKKILGKGDFLASYSYVAYQLGIYTENRPVFYACSGSNILFIIASSEQVFSDKWYNIVGIWDRSTAKIFVNGTNKGTDDTVGSGLINDVSYNLTLSSQFSTRAFNGIIDNIQIYNQSTSSSQIQQNYYSGINKLFKNKGIVLNEFNQRLTELKSNLTINE